MHELAIWLGSRPLLGDQSEVLRGLARGFPANQPEPTASRLLTGVLFLVSFAALVWLLARVARRNDKRGSYNNPRALFRALCKLHRLDRTQRKLLLRLAQARQLEQPAALFLEPLHFETADLPQPWQAQAESLEILHRALFSRTPDAPGTG
ncbi:MAG TPA: hypothetical protein VHC19_11135 [Pirellulales bacterium]|nr:hypothetical protein [Pirellulales bacterium]